MRRRLHPTSINGPLSQRLKIMQKHGHPQWHSHFIFLLELIPFSGLGEHIGDYGFPLQLRDGVFLPQSQSGNHSK